MDELQQALSDEIRNHRLDLKDMTQDALAIHSGVSRATIANIERGRQSVTIGILYRLSRALRVDAGTLLNKAINKTYPETDRTILLSDVDNKQEVLNTLNKYI